MGEVVSSAQWARYKKIIDKAHGSFNQDTLIWIKYNDSVPRYNEELGENGTRIELKALIGYNSFRTWPITRRDNAGELDNQNMVAYINRQYLIDLGYTTPQGYFNFRPDKDYFIHRGLRYKAEGDTLLSQAYDDPLLVLIVLKREELKNGETMFQQSEVTTAIIEVPKPVLVIKSLTPEF